MTFKNIENNKINESLTISKESESKIIKPLLTHWVEDYWLHNIPKGLTTMEIDECVQKLFSTLLVMGGEKDGSKSCLFCKYDIIKH